MSSPQTSNSLDLPAPLTELECADFRAWQPFEPSMPISYSDGSRNITDILERHVDASNHALLRRLAHSTVPQGAVGDLISASWYSPDKHDFLHNMLLLIEELHHHGINMNSLVFVKLTLGINHNLLPSDWITRITTVDELKGTAAVYRLAHALGPENQNTVNADDDKIIVIRNPHLDRMIRSDPSLVDLATPFLEERILGISEEDLAPLIDYLHSDTASSLSSGWL